MSRINELILQWPRGTVKSSKELSELGYSPQILARYVNSGWIQLIARGAYTLSGDLVDWQGGLYCLQKDSASLLHVGARTALELKGFGHYLSGVGKKIELFNRLGHRLPRWFTLQPWMNNINYFRTDIFRYDSKKTFSLEEITGISVKISSPELAILEMLYLVPKHHSFEEVGLIMESLTTLRGEVLQILLEKCSSVKVNRLFFLLADKYNHSWLTDLRGEKINFGDGKRKLVSEGKLNKKYSITVPKNYEE